MWECASSVWECVKVCESVRGVCESVNDMKYVIVNWRWLIMMKSKYDWRSECYGLGLGYDNEDENEGGLKRVKVN